LFTINDTYGSRKPSDYPSDEYRIRLQKLEEIKKQKINPYPSATVERMEIKDYWRSLLSCGKIERRQSRWSDS
jgi:lysyl-tRNA synthetase class II